MQIFASGQVPEAGAVVKATLLINHHAALRLALRKYTDEMDQVHL